MSEKKPASEQDERAEAERPLVPRSYEFHVREEVVARTIAHWKEFQRLQELDKKAG
jgi:hypothetical protein